jgi:hypothetical protein
MIKKKPFVKYDIETKEQYVFSIWLNKDEQKALYELGSRLREAKPSTIIKKSLQIALTKLRSEQEIIELMYNRGINNKRTGLDELEIIQQQLSKLLNKSNNKKD